MRTFADAEVALAQALPGYESRAPQQVLAAGVENLYAQPHHFKPYSGAPEDYVDWDREAVHFLGQAGTGTGKSLGYLIPAILSGRRTVVSVTTKALQDQLAGKDLPFLSEHLPVDFTYALLKGRSNYLCVNRLGVNADTDIDVASIIALTENPEFDGLRESIPFEVPHYVWAKISGDSEECHDLGCSSGEGNCYAVRARANAASATIVVVNHALFCTDLMMKSWGIEGMLGEYDAVVFDEAHELEDVAGNTLGGELKENTFRQVTTEIRNWAEQYADEGSDPLLENLLRVDAAGKAFFERLKVGRIKMPELNEVAEPIADLYDAVSALRSSLRAAKYDRTPDYDRAKKRKAALARRLAGAGAKVESIFADGFDETVRWVEEERMKKDPSKTFKVVKIAPILVAPFLRKWLFTKTPTVLVSATLAVKGSFDYITGRLGIDLHQGIDVGTPFDFPVQARLYVPVMLPEPKGVDQEVWQAMANEEILRLITISRGRALVLFTSVKHMREAFAATKMRSDLDLRMQGDAPTPQLVEWLKDHDGETTGKVLFATKSFFTGVDISGEALSLVIVAKMPFPVPTEPLTEARCEAIEMAGGSSFNDYTIPVMSLVLQQAAGRLIRHRGDTGVVAILDPRIVTKSYGKRILRDLPPMTQTFDMAEVEAFLS